MGGDDHRCEWRERAEGLQVQLDRANATIAKLTEKLAAVESTLEKLQRHVFGQRSEKMPPVAEAIRDPARAEAARISALQKRRENAEKRRQLVTRRIDHKVREDQKVCPKCGGRDFTGSATASRARSTSSSPRGGGSGAASAAARQRGGRAP